MTNKKSHIYSNLLKSIKNGKFVITGELEPERTGNLHSLIEEAIKIEPYIDAANITDNPGSFVRVDSLASSIIIEKETNVEPIFQLTCRDRNRLGLASALLGAAAANIKNVLVLTGDYTSLGDVPSSKPVFDFDSAQLLELAREIVDKKTVFGQKIKETKEHPPQFHIGIGANPNSTDPEMELAKIKRKVEMGAEFIQTQVIYELDKTEDFLKELNTFGIPVLVGLFPMKSYNTAYWFNKLVAGVDVPKQVLADFKNIKDKEIDKKEKKKYYDKINVELFKPIIEELKKKNYATGLHITAIGYSRIFSQLLE